MLINEIIDTNIQPGDFSSIPLSKKHTKVVNFIKTNCSDILKLYQRSGQYLYHGFKEKHQLLFLGNPRTDRKPRNSEPKFQEAIDNHLKDAGFKALRSNSIFCVPLRRRSSYYGSPYIIFPLNGFNYTWSDKFFDIYVCDKDIEIYLPFDAKTFIKNVGFKNNEGIEKALNIDNEICINGNYVAIASELYSTKNEIKLRPIFDQLGLSYEN